MCVRRARLLLCIVGPFGTAVGCKADAQDQTECSLARVKDVAIGWTDVRQVQGQVRVVGGDLSDQDALIDVLWQEVGRQEQGLPGGAEIYKSRRLVVRKYRSGRSDQKPAFVRGAIPRDAVLTECGTRLIYASSRDTRIPPRAGVLKSSAALPEQ